MAPKSGPIFVVAIAAALLAGCNGGGGSLAPNGPRQSSSHTTMTIAVTRDAARTTASVTREALSIPATTKAIEVVAYSGSLAKPSSGALFTAPATPIGKTSSCVEFPASTNSVSISTEVPLGAATVVINARSGACNGAIGTGTIVSQAVGTGTAVAGGGDLGATFFGLAAGQAIGLVIPGMIAGTPPPLAGATQSIAKNISAANGGTLILPSGSSLVIKPGALKEDVAAQIAFIPNSGIKPNNATFKVAGATVRVAFYRPYSGLASAEYRAIDYAPGYRRSLARDKHAIAAPMFVTLVHVAAGGEFSENAFSLPLLKIYGAKGPVDISAPSDAIGNVDAAVTIPIPDPAAIASFALATAGELYDAVAVYDAALTYIPLGSKAIGLIAPGLRYYDPVLHKWGTVPLALPKPVHPLLLIHGIASSVSAAYEDSSSPELAATNAGTLLPDTVETLRENGGYDAVFGFDYNWLDTPEHVSPQIAQAINAFNFPRLDIVAHSYGTVIAMATIPKLNATTEIQNLVLYQGPLNGAILAPGFFESALLNIIPSKWATLHKPDSLLSITTDYLDIYVPGNARLAAIRAAMLAAPNAPQRVIKVAGNTSLEWEQKIRSIFDSVFPNSQAELWDGIIPIKSALEPSIIGQETKRFPKGLDFDTATMVLDADHTGVGNNPAFVKQIQSLIHVKLTNANPYSNAYAKNAAIFTKGQNVRSRLYNTQCGTATLDPLTLLPFYSVAPITVPCSNSINPPADITPYVWVFKPLELPVTKITSTPTASTLVSYDGRKSSVQLDFFTIPDCTTCLPINLQDVSRTISERLSRAASPVTTTESSQPHLYNL